MKQRFLKTEILALLFTLVTLLFLSGCGERTVTVIEDLSLSAPTTFVPLDESTDLGSSYVKMNNATEDTQATEQNTETPEEASETEIADELTAQEQNALDKRVYREGDLIAFDPIGLDPDGDVITYSYSRPLDEKGQWQTGIGDEGTYLVTISASDGKTEVEKKVVILVLSANRAPTIDGLDDMTVAEGDLVVLKPKIFDYNGDEVSILYSKPFNENGEWQTDYDDSGVYVAKVTVNDGTTTVEEQITLTVADENRAPVLASLDSITALAGDLVTINPTATDEDGDTVTFSFESPVSSDGTWQTTDADEGSHTLTVSASDGKESVSSTVSVVLAHKNKAPSISLDDIRVEETEKIVLSPTISDPEGDSYTITFSDPFDAHGTWQTDYDDSGTYTVTVTATDSNGASNSVVIQVLVANKNRAPVFKI
ncbi:PKD domain-containing protein [Candidatus Woesearchaeota archaeon]|nr:PKD domain-containing protein [Candidatus Woesearchaeota archaeon]